MSTNEIAYKAQQLGVHGLSSHELDSFHGVVKHPAAPFFVPRAYNVQNKHKITVKQAPQNGISGSAWLNGTNPTDFQIDPSQLSVLTNAYFQVKITNNTGAGVTLAPTPFWVDQIDIMNNTGQVLTSINGQELFLTLAFLSRNEFEQMCSYMCISSAYATTGTVLANGASGVYYIPLFHLLSSAKLHLAGLLKEIIIRIKTNTTSLTLLAGSHPTVTEVSLILKGYNEPNKHREARRATYNAKNMPLKLPFQNWQLVRDTQTLAASTQYSVNLNGFRGPLVGLFFTIRSGPNAAATQGTYQAISSYDVQLASGESLTGSYVKLHEDFKIEAAEIFDNLACANSDFYFIPFSSHIVKDYGTGSVHGYQIFSGQERLIFTTNSSIVGGAFQIDVYGLRPSHLHIENGQIIRKE